MNRIALLCIGLICISTCAYSADLAKDGTTGWKIVLPDEPTIVETTAARELSDHLKLVTGAGFPTIPEKDVPADGRSFIFIGNHHQGKFIGQRHHFLPLHSHQRWHSHPEQCHHHRPDAGLI